MVHLRSKNTNKLIYTSLLLVCVVGFWLFDNFYTPDTYSDDAIVGNRTTIPEWFLPSSTTGDIVAHEHFMLSYNEPYEQAEWVAYLLKKEHLSYDNRKRPYFIEDPKVRTKSADWRNYKRSGYDRGHLCPAGDRRFSKQAYNETFYTSNISPQQSDFNAGIWNRLERLVRQWAKKYGTVFVVTGGVLGEGLNEIGVEDVDVPKYFYKIVARGKANDLKVIGFLMPAKESSRPLEQFIVPIDSIEKVTKINFFKNIKKEHESKLERKVTTENWQL